MSMTGKRKRGSGGGGEKVEAKDGVPLSEMGQVFAKMKESLDHKTARRDRVFLASREITLLSKRAIFLLHRSSTAPPLLDPSSSSSTSIMAEAASKLQEIRSVFAMVAADVQGQDYDRFHRQLSPGLQEFIEAASFLHYLQHGSLITPHALHDAYFLRDVATTTTATATQEGEGEVQEKGDAPVKEEDEKAGGVFLFVPSEEDYVLGVADLTGEVMRHAINCVGAGDHHKAFDMLKFLRSARDLLLRATMFAINDLKGKLATLDDTLRKVEKCKKSQSFCLLLSCCLNLSPSPSLPPSL